MFGIGSGEMLVFAVVVLIALGPKRLPDFMRTVGKGLREVRKATNDLRKHSGIDELMRDDPAGLRALSRDISRAPAPRREQKLTAHDLAKEAPADGVDIAHARYLAKKHAAAAAKEAAIARESALAPATVTDSAAVGVGATVAIESSQPSAAPSTSGFEGDTVPDKSAASPPVRHEPTMMGIPAVDPYALPASKSAPPKSNKKTLEGLASPTATKASAAPSGSSPSVPPSRSAPPPPPPPRSSSRPSAPPPPPRSSSRPSAPPPPVPVTRSAPPPPPRIGASPILSGKRPSLAPSVPPPAPSLAPSVPPPAPAPAPADTREATMAIEVEDLTLDES